MECLSRKISQIDAFVHYRQSCPPLPPAVLCSTAVGHFSHCCSGHQRPTHIEECGEVEREVNTALPESSPTEDTHTHRIQLTVTERQAAAELLLCHLQLHCCCCCCQLSTAFGSFSFSFHLPLLPSDCPLSVRPSPAFPSPPPAIVNTQADCSEGTRIAH